MRQLKQYFEENKYNKKHENNSTLTFYESPKGIKCVMGTNDLFFHVKLCIKTHIMLHFYALGPHFHNNTCIICLPRHYDKLPNCDKKH